MSIFDGDYYDNISNPSKWMAIIVSDYEETDNNWKYMKTDKENIKKMLAKLGFSKDNIREIHNKANNVIFKETPNFITFADDNDDDRKIKHDGYIMMFNLTYKKSGNEFRAGKGWYTTEDVLNCFVVNNLEEWSTKPKLIFYQTDKYVKQNNLNSIGEADNISKEDIKIDYPIEADIFQSFSNDENEESRGNENGSFYIQSLCEIINQHIDNGTIKNIDLMHIMYKVHARMSQMIGMTGLQTPRFKSTFIKKFVFPVL